MKDSIIISLLVGVLLTISLPFRSLAQPAQWVLDKYEPYNYLYKYNSVDKELAYRLMRPINFDASKKYPVIITLHGGTAFRLPQSPRYNIYSLQEYNEQLADSAIRSEYPAYVLVPQGKSDNFWIREDLAGIQGIVATLLSVDLNRIYIMGTSAGGNGTHDFISADPDYFAAAISSAANPDKIDPTKRANLVNFNLWHMVGETDLDQNRYPGSVAFFNDMKSRNAKMKFTIFWKAGHSIGGSMIGSEQIFSTYRNGFKTELAGTDSDPEPNTMKWLFSKSKNANTAISSVNSDNLAKSIYFNTTNSTVSWSSTSTIDYLEVYDIAGMAIKEYSTKSVNSIDLSSLKSGMYVLRLYNQNLAAFSKKVINISK